MSWASRQNKARAEEIIQRQNAREFSETIPIIRQKLMDSGLSQDATMAICGWIQLCYTRGTIEEGLNEVDAEQLIKLLDMAKDRVSKAEAIKIFNGIKT